MPFRGLLALPLLVVLTRGAAAQPDAARAFERAENHYRADEVLAAEPLYLRALGSSDPTIRRQSAERHAGAGDPVHGRSAPAWVAPATRASGYQILAVPSCLLI